MLNYRLVRILAVAGLVLSLGFASACGADRFDGTTRDVLEQTTPFALKPTGQLVAMTIREFQDGAWVEDDVQFRVRSGTVTMRVNVNGSLIIEELEMELEDVVAAQAVVEGGLHFTELRLFTEGILDNITTRWRDDEEALEAEFHSDIMMDWALRLENGQGSLQTQRFEDSDITATVERSAREQIELTIAGEIEGTFWTFLNSIEFADLQVLLSGVFPD